MDDFEDAWNAYPRKVAKAEARKAWKQTQNIRPPLDTILHAIKAASRSDQWMKANGQFIPHFSTWLRGERWEDSFEVKLPDVVNEKPWHETATGIEKKGAELGLNPAQFGHWQEFKIAVLRKAMKAA